MISNELDKTLSNFGYSVAYLSRKENRAKNIFKWDYKRDYLDPKAIEWADAIINLAGESVAKKRWTKAVKEEIYNSRINSIKLLKKSLLEIPNKVQYLVSASAVGYYNQDSDQIMTEESENGDDFLAILVSDWEKELFDIKNSTICALRIGVVLSSKGGALPQLSKPIQMGLGANLGTGKQIVPWIHIDDLVNIFVFAIENKLLGVYNAIAVNTSSETLNLKISEILGKRIMLPNVPAFALKLMLGQMANMILKGSRVSNEKIKNKGFQFKYKDLALRALLLLSK